MKAKPRLGFLGLGWIGTRRLEALLMANTSEVVALADSSERALERALTLVPEARRFTSLEELLDEIGADLEGLVIATPSASHAAQSIAALERGIAVFCQKPLGRSAAEVQAIVDAALISDVLLGVDLSYRFTDGIQKIRQEIAKGKLGNIYAANLVFHNAYGPDKPWFYEADLSGGGCVIDLGTHLVDLATWIIDSPVVGVTSRLFKKGAPIAIGPIRAEVEDYALARLDFESGATASLSCSWNLNAGQDAGIEISFYGDQGGASLKNVNGSFVDFVAEFYRGTSKELLTQPPDNWGGRALIDWTGKLASRTGFDDSLLNSIEVARIIDAIYDQCQVQFAPAK